MCLRDPPAKVLSTAFLKTITRRRSSAELIQFQVDFRHGEKGVCGRKKVEQSEWTGHHRASDTIG
jgi:hypothetical protein